MKKLMKRKNNKGFSLVELIVVVLIMGIIAVALAPQVMKWVGKSKESTDTSNAAAIKSSVQAALADFQINESIPTSGQAKFTINGNLDPKIDWGTTPNKLSEKIEEVMAGDYPKTQSVSTGFTVTVDGGTGKVEVEY